MLMFEIARNCLHLRSLLFCTVVLFLRNVTHYNCWLIAYALAIWTRKHHHSHSSLVIHWESFSVWTIRVEPTVWYTSLHHLLSDNECKLASKSTQFRSKSIPLRHINKWYIFNSQIGFDKVMSNLFKLNQLWKSSNDYVSIRDDNLASTVRVIAKSFMFVFKNGRDHPHACSSYCNGQMSGCHNSLASSPLVWAPSCLLHEQPLHFYRVFDVLFFLSGS